jgi:L-ascorbate metabolism protein UlaG (beta-lactamase superfamily)
MEIIWFGQACFLIRSKNGYIVTDPYSEECGLRLPKNLKADIVTVSHNHFDHNNIKAVSGMEDDQPPFVINGPGEYEVNKIEIIGFPTFHDNQKGNLRGKNTVYTFKLEDLEICHLGDLGHSLSDEEIEKLNQVDVLLVPVGGTYTIDAKKALEVINQIDPKIVIPMHYQIEGLSTSISLEGVDKFLKEIGAEVTPLDLLKISKNDLEEEERKIFVLIPRIH